MEQLSEIMQDIINSGVLPNPVTFVAQIISTLVLFYFLRRWFWKPLSELLEKRRQAIVDELESARLLNEEASLNRELAEKELTEIKQKAAQIIEEAKREAEKTRALLLQQAEQAVEAYRERALQEIEQQRLQVEKELKTQVVDLAFALAEKLIENNLDYQMNQRIVEDFIKEVGVN